MDWYNSFLLISTVLFALILIIKAFNFVKIHDKFTKSLYYECHITIDPIFEEERDKLQNLINPYKFKLANLLMQKRKDDLPELSKYDTFMTAHDKTELGMFNNMKEILKVLKLHGYVIRRYKIEKIIIDSRTNDILEIMEV